MQPHEQLEQELIPWCGTPHVVACSSGTAALHLALEALRLHPGQILVPDYTMIACARAVTLAGHRPVFVDCGNDLLLDPARIEDAPWSPKECRAILVTHIYGRRCDTEAIHRFAARRNMVVIEDMAELHGQHPHEKTVAACWSFYANKVVAGEEGGAIGFRELEVADLARSLRCLGFTETHDFYHVPRGHNYRLAPSLARLVLDSLARYPENLAARRELEQHCEGQCPPEWRMPPRLSPWVYDLRLPGCPPELQAALVSTLNDLGVPARHGFKPMVQQEEYISSQPPARRTMWSAPTGKESNAARLASEILYLPLTPGKVTKEMLTLAFEVLTTAFNRALAVLVHAPTSGAPPHSLEASAVPPSATGHG